MREVGGERWRSPLEELFKRHACTHTHTNMNISQVPNKKQGHLKQEMKLSLWCLNDFIHTNISNPVLSRIPVLITFNIIFCDITLWLVLFIFV